MIITFKVFDENGNGSIESMKVADGLDQDAIEELVAEEFGTEDFEIMSVDF